jgi:hypothetical protein
MISYGKTSCLTTSADGRRFAAIGVEQNGKALSTGKSCDMAFVWTLKPMMPANSPMCVNIMTPTRLSRHSSD